MDYTNVKMRADGDTIRFALLKDGEQMLYVFGVNPSTATDKKPDRTMQKVLGFADRNGFDGFAMMNLYPLRSTNPNALPKAMDEELHQRNLTEIKEVIGKKKNPVILFAFGNAIGAAPYLKKCLKDIVSTLQPLNPQWKQIGKPTKWGNPRHPLYAHYVPFENFDVEAYLK
ncbi:MAG: DUF1643 domain-containing protein [Bacteroidaceae bacterium]|nr:DUF1643 domain-containing protein [Bacteroidaceae bacterium]